MIRPTERATERGVALVESALTLLGFFVLLLGILEAGRFLSIQQTLTNSAREGARFAVMPLTRTRQLPSESEVASVVTSFLDAARVGSADVSVTRETRLTRPAPPQFTEYTRVTVTKPYSVVTLAMFSPLEITLKGEALMRNETSPK